MDEQTRCYLVAALLGEEALWKFGNDNAYERAIALKNINIRIKKLIKIYEDTEPWIDGKWGIKSWIERGDVVEEPVCKKNETHPSSWISQEDYCLHVDTREKIYIKPHSSTSRAITVDGIIHNADEAVISLNKGQCVLLLEENIYLVIYPDGRKRAFDIYALQNYYDNINVTNNFIYYAKIKTSRQNYYKNYKSCSQYVMCAIIRRHQVTAITRASKLA